MKALIQRRLGKAGDRGEIDRTAAEHDRSHGGRRDQLGGIR